jgi:copper(I)-binding protein
MESSLAGSGCARATLQSPRVDRTGNILLISNSSRFLLSIVLIGLLVSCESAQPDRVLSLHGAWVRVMPPGMKMTAAYGEITNTGSATIEISTFDSDSYADVSLHKTILENGLSKMVPVPVLSLDPGGSEILEPGGLHLMLLQPTREFVQDDRIELSLYSTSGEKFTFTVAFERH